MKECSKCHRVLPESEFYKRKNNKDGLDYCCIDCQKEYQKDLEKRYALKNEKRTDLDIEKGKKVCSKCRQLKEKINFNKKRNNKDGLNVWCRECERECNTKLTEKYKSINEKRTDVYKGKKQCIKCKKWKDKHNFYPNRTRRDGLHNTCIQCQKEYYQKNKEYFKQYWKDNPEKFGTYYYIKKFGYTPEEIKKIRKKAAQKFFQKNKNKEEYKKTKRKDRRNYCIRHPERQRPYLFKERKLSHAFSLKEWENKVKEANGICPLCNRFFEEGYGLSLDHTPPVSKAPIGFRYMITDVQPICRSCNSSKNNRFEGYTPILSNFF